MSEKPVKPIPAVGTWIQNFNERDILYVSEVDPVKERIRIKRFARYGAEGPEFDGRTTWLSYETYRRGTRYMPREAPVNPDCLPEKITREQAQEALELDGWSPGGAAESLDNAAEHVDSSMFSDRERAILRAYLGKPTPAVTPPDGMPVTALVGVKIVNLLDGPERNDVPAAQPPLADVLAAIEALRAEVRADRKPLLDAVDQVLASIEDGSALGVTRRAVALDDLRNARAKVAG